MLESVPNFSEGRDRETIDALAGALGGRRGEVVAYEAVKPWATGVGLMSFPTALAA